MRVEIRCPTGSNPSVRTIGTSTCLLCRFVPANLVEDPGVQAAGVFRGKVLLRGIVREDVHISNSGTCVQIGKHFRTYEILIIHDKINFCPFYAQ